MNYCEHCGSKIDSGSLYCSNCGAPINKKEKEVVNGTIVNNQYNDGKMVKDNTTTAFVCSLIGFLCCAILAIPGLILSIQSLQLMKEGKISSDKKWMAIAGIILSSIGLVLWIYNILNPANTEEIIRKVTEKLDLENAFLFK